MCDWYPDNNDTHADERDQAGSGPEQQEPVSCCEVGALWNRRRVHWSVEERMWWPYDGQRNVVGNLSGAGRPWKRWTLQQCTTGNPKIGSILIRMLRFDDKSDGSVMIMMNVMNFGISFDSDRFVCVIRRKNTKFFVEDVGYKWIILGASVCAKGVVEYSIHPFITLIFEYWYASKLTSHTNTDIQAS